MGLLELPALAPCQNVLGGFWNSHQQQLVPQSGSKVVVEEAQCVPHGRILHSVSKRPQRVSVAVHRLVVYTLEFGGLEDI